MARHDYSGGCHCGAVRFEVRADLDRTVICNCSICSVRAFLWAFVPAADFRLLAGERELVGYRFNDRVIDHRFCRTCGIEAFAFSQPEGNATAMINVRCLEGVIVAELAPPSRYDGSCR